MHVGAWPMHDARIRMPGVVVLRLPGPQDADRHNGKC